MDLKITDVRAHPGDSAFLLDDGHTAILYDTGFAFTGYAVADNIQKALGTRPLDYILLTHSHYDHALGTPYICARYPDAKVVAGEYAVKIFGKPTARAVMRDLDQKFAMRCGVGDYEDRIDELHVDIPVADGDVIRAGTLELVAVALLGHTKCSIAYYLPRQKILLSCETLGVYDGGRLIVPSYLVGYEMTLASIDKAKALDIDRILLPHCGLLDAEKTAFYLQNCRQSAVDTAQSIRSILEKGGTLEDAEQFFIHTFYREGVPAIYPEDAMRLNTSIMVKLLNRELLNNV